MCTVVTFPHSVPYKDFSCLFHINLLFQNTVYLYHLASLDGSHCQRLENMILDVQEVDPLQMVCKWKEWCTCNQCVNIVSK